MKRKRANARSKPREAPVVVSNETSSKGRFLNAKDQIGLNDFDYAKYDSRMESEAPRANSNMSSWKADPNLIREMIKSIVGDLFKGAGGIAAGPPRDIDSSSNSPFSNTPFQHQGGRMDEEKSRVPHLDPRYKEQELKDALSVIRKIMKLDAAEPFSLPVDPIALGIPDYFDVIDTPMDFGTISKDLENGLKYMNSEDVYKDVQNIWENCCKYNKEGDHILELMKRVKMEFMKHWTAAGLYREQPQAIDESIQRHSTRNKKCQPGPVAEYIGPRQVQDNLLPSLDELPQFNTQQPQPSMQQVDMDTSTSDEGFFPISPLTKSTTKRQEHGKESLVAPVTNNSIQHQQDEIGPSQMQVHQHTSVNSQTYQPELSSNQPQPFLQLGDATESAIKQKKRRGPTRCLKLLTQVGRIAVEIDELGQPIGREAPKLTSFLGVVARDGNLAPLTYASWNKVPDENKENMWQKVLLKFDIDPKCRTWVLKAIGDRWKRFKSCLKASHYDTHATDAERLADRDERVLPDQWPVLVSQWNSEEWQSMSAQNKANRSKLKFIHTTGTKTFARVCEEERAKRPDGKEPSRAELFILTHTRKNGEPVNDETAAVITELREHSAQQPETLQNNIDPEDDIFARVMGQARNDTKLLYGLGPSITARKPTRADAMRMVTKATAEVHEMKEKMVSMENTCAQMASQMAAMMSMIGSISNTPPDKHVSNVVAHTADASEDLPLQPVRTRAVPSRQTRASARNKR